MVPQTDNELLRKVEPSNHQLGPPALRYPSMEHPS